MAKKAKVEFDNTKQYCLNINTKTGAFNQELQGQEAPGSSQAQYPQVDTNTQLNAEIQMKATRQNKHSEEAVVPALKAGKKTLTFQEQLDLFDQQVA